MPHSFTLFTYPEHTHVPKIFIAAKLAGITLTLPKGLTAESATVEQAKPEFRRKSPLGKFPVLDTGKGYIFDANAILRYFVRLTGDKLAPADTVLASQVDQWLDFATNEVETSALCLVGPTVGALEYNHDLDEKARANVTEIFQALNLYLETRTFLVGERLSVADVALTCALVPLFQLYADAAFREPYPNVSRWFATTTNQPSFVEVLGPITWVEKAELKAGGKKAGKGKEAKPEKKEKAPKEEQPKKEKAPKEAPKKAEKPAEKPKAEEPEEEDDAPKEPVAKNPLDLLPKSTFVLDEFKRTYSNKDTRTEAVPYFLEHFDPEGYSLWWCKYRYNEECTVGFKTTNLIGGFFQRMERMHKYGFGSMLIAGEPNLHGIYGFWILRGDKIPEIMEDVPDTENYEWTKISWPLDDATKAKVADYLAWDVPIEGQPVIEGKCFK